MIITSQQYDNYVDELRSACPDFLKDRIDLVRIARIPDSDGYYVTDYGNIVSLQKDEPRVLVTWPNQYGHQYTRINGDNGKRTVSVHRTVAEAFIPNPNNSPLVRHMNDNPYDNGANNLAWGTQLDNVRDCHEHGRAFTKRVILDNGMRFNSCAEAADYLGVSKSAITMACKGVIKTIHNHTVRYSTDGE